MVPMKIGQVKNAFSDKKKNQKIFVNGLSENADGKTHFSKMILIWKIIKTMDNR